MLDLLRVFADAFRDMRRRRKTGRRFLRQGYTQVDAPPVAAMLPWLYPDILRDDVTECFQKDEVRVLLISTRCTPRSRQPLIGRSFVLMCTQLADVPAIRRVSAGLRDPSELCSIVDLLHMDSYLGVSPLDKCMVFATDLNSANHACGVVDQMNAGTGAGSVVIHGGKLFVQMQSDEFDI